MRLHAVSVDVVLYFKQLVNPIVIESFQKLCVLFLKIMYFGMFQ